MRDSYSESQSTVTQPFNHLTNHSILQKKEIKEREILHHPRLNSINFLFRKLFETKKKREIFKACGTLQTENQEMRLQNIKQISNNKAQFQRKSLILDWKLVSHVKFVFQNHSQQSDKTFDKIQIQNHETFQKIEVKM